MSAALAFGWHVWTRHRLGLTLCAAYWLLLLAAASVLPVEPLLGRPRGEARLPPLYLLAGVGGVFGYLVLVFSFSKGSRLEACESGFPARLWTLPLRTRSLVGWPMLWGTAALAAAWLTLAWGVIRPWFGLNLPLLYWWPALALAVTMAWLQAVLWSPSPLPGLRLFLLGPLLGAGLVLPQLVVEWGAETSVACGLLAAQLPAAYLAAVYGVSRARRGDAPCWSWPGWRALLRWRSATSVRPAFASPAGAQRWFEWRRCGLSFPTMAFVFALPWLPAAPWVAGFLDESAAARVHLVPAALHRELGGLGATLAAVFVFLPLMATACGTELGKLPRADRAGGLSPFLAARPIPTAALVRAKFETAARSTLAGWGVMAAGVLLWLALGGHAAEVRAQFEAIRQRHPPGVFWGWCALLVGGSVVLTWLQIVQGLWLSLARPWRATLVVTVGFFGFVGLALLVQRLMKSPADWEAARRLLPWVAAAAVVLKGVAASWSLGALRRRGLLSSAAVLRALAAWLVLAAGLLAALYGLLPHDATTTSGVVLGLALMLPLTRLALALLTLDAVRHR